MHAHRNMVLHKFSASSTFVRLFMVLKLTKWLLMYAAHFALEDLLAVTRLRCCFALVDGLCFVLADDDSAWCMPVGKKPHAF